MKVVPVKTNIPVLWIAAASLALLILGFGVYKYVGIQKELDRLKTSPASVADAAKNDIKRLTEEIGKLMVLPQDEMPTVATVTDVSKLLANPFFSQAQKGDRVLIYANAKKVILYRPGEKKIVDVGPISISSQSASAEKLSVTLLNGTTTAGLTKKFEPRLLSKQPSLSVSNRDNAKRRDYEKSIVVDVKKTREKAVADIAASLNMTVGDLPQSEATPTSDIVIILGSDVKE